MMAEHGHEEVKRLFELAAACPPNDRENILDRECGGDAGLKRRVLAMVAASEDERFFASPTAEGQMTAAIDPIAAAKQSYEDVAALREAPGTRIGRYKLLQLIGEGGFGSVFMAEQEKPVARRVALKIIKLGMDTAQVVARFEQERQALAMMDHPNIAKVFDAGATETGRPYFVMELCKGDPISEYCDKNNLSIKERLELFAQVCQAVQHAHTKGVIHRDIKPTNVLVSTQDGRPHAKVIDFGIAKATSSKLTDKTLFTEHRQLIGTLEYMSPEQAEGSLDIDTRTDVYSLGILLYELLTGSTPFSGKELRSAAYGEMQRMIREKDPPKPSTRLLQNTDTLASVAARRQSEPRKLGSIVRGELDWIVMKALEKDRARRYETANGLAADVRRYLSGEAVVAAPPSASYRVRKFAARHRRSVLAALVVGFALVLGVVGTSIGMIAANRQRVAAENAKLGEVEQRRLAEARLAESESTVQFLDEMLGAVDPLAQGKDVTVRAVLDEASKSVGSRFGERPLVAARLHGTVGRTYMGLGVYDKADDHIREQLRIRLKELGPDSEDTCRSVNDLGFFLIKSGRPKEAEELLKKAIADHERLFGRSHPITVQSMDSLAMLYVEQTRPADAEPLLREVLQARMRTPGPESTETLGSMNSLATLYADTERYEEAEKLFESAIKIQEKLSGADHPLSLELRGNFAWMEYWAGMNDEKAGPELKKSRLQKAKVIGEQTLEGKRRILGEDHQSTLATINNLASVYTALGDHAKSEEFRKKDLEITRRVLGDDHPDTAVSFSNMGNFLRHRGRCSEALPYLEQAIRISRKVLPPGNQGTAYSLGGYGSCLRDLGRFAEAEGPLLEASETMAKALGPENVTTRRMNYGLVLLYEQWDKAEPGKGYGDRAAAWRAKSGEEK